MLAILTLTLNPYNFEMIFDITEHENKDQIHSK